MKPFLLILSFFAFFSVSAQIPNGSFEDWDGLNPAGWTTSNNDTVVPPFSTVLVRKDTLNPLDGNNAMVLLQNWSYSSWAETVFANTGHPTSLSAYVRCNAYDTVAIRIELLNNGTVIDKGSWSVADTVITDWTKITIPITQSLLEVFETRIYIQGGRVPGPADEVSVLWVDSLSLGYAPLGEQDMLAQKEWILSPNPTNGVIHILSKTPHPIFGRLKKQWCGAECWDSRLRQARIATASSISNGNIMRFWPRGLRWR